MNKRRKPAARTDKPPTNEIRETEETITIGRHVTRCRVRHEVGKGYTVTGVGIGSSAISMETLAEAREQARDAILLWLDATEDDDRVQHLVQEPDLRSDA